MMPEVFQIRMLRAHDGFYRRPAAQDNGKGSGAKARIFLGLIGTTEVVP
jgi:hypothetical protein